VVRYLVVAALYVPAYVALSRLGTWVGGGDDTVSVWYPGAGLSLALPVLIGWRGLPVVFLAVVLDNLLAGGAETIGGAGEVLWVALAVTAGAALGGMLLRGLTRLDPQLPRLRDTVWLVATVPFAAAMIALLAARG
jgi:hypothetical protein